MVLGAAWVEAYDSGWQRSRANFAGAQVIRANGPLVVWHVCKALNFCSHAAVRTHWRPAARLEVQLVSEPEQIALMDSEVYHVSILTVFRTWKVLTARRLSSSLVELASCSALPECACLLAWYASGSKAAWTGRTENQKQTTVKNDRQYMLPGNRATGSSWEMGSHWSNLMTGQRHSHPTVISPPNPRNSPRGMRLVVLWGIESGDGLPIRKSGLPQEATQEATQDCILDMYNSQQRTGISRERG